MQDLETSPTLRESLAEVIAKHHEASVRHASLRADYLSAAASGDDAKADELEAEAEKAYRLTTRLEVRRAALEEQVCSADELERAERAATLKASADSILSLATSRVTDMVPLADKLAKLVDALESDYKAWTEARFLARQAGAMPEGFATQENEARTRHIVDSLARSKTRVANICGELSRVSVFM